MKFLLVSYIVNIRQNPPWYYNACYKCGKRINTVPKTNLSYTSPDKISKSVVIKCKMQYIIPINIQDHTSTIKFTHFDRKTKRLLDINAFELKKIHEAAGDNLQLFPNQMNVLRNRKFAFLVDIISYNVNNDNNIYTIVKLTEDVSIISELESKLELMYPWNQIQTDESFTPSTVDKSSSTSPMKISGDLKRNLHDIYGVDGGDDLSSTKSKRKSIGEGNPLLVPKVEK
uniref:Replication factor A C-terminal domain-containing protein n=1 Tax=Lactuca sativa TaxID=4236 RepID=A0A9R1UNN7_LACSA|nr:hypothetical protein LSAT_V11C800451070 [Lactuca sativa]